MQPPKFGSTGLHPSGQSWAYSLQTYTSYNSQSTPIGNEATTQADAPRTTTSFLTHILTCLAEADVNSKFQHSPIAHVSTVTRRKTRREITVKDSRPGIGLLQTTTLTSPSGEARGRAQSQDLLAAMNTHDRTVLDAPPPPAPGYVNWAQAGTGAEQVLVLPGAGWWEENRGRCIPGVYRRSYMLV